MHNKTCVLKGKKRTDCARFIWKKKMCIEWEFSQKKIEKEREKIQKLINVQMRKNVHHGKNNNLSSDRLCKKLFGSKILNCIKLETTLKIFEVYIFPRILELTCALAYMPAHPACPLFHSHYIKNSNNMESFVCVYI